MALYRTLFKGICGSIAYGLNHADSDVDERGVFAYPTNVVLGLDMPAETIEVHEPDVCLHEVGKFLRLARANNPNILEMFWLEEYTEMTPEGYMLLGARDIFLSQKVRKTYAGYAMSQIHRLEVRAEKGDASFGSDLRKRYSKHARHCFRLIQQGRMILETGKLVVKVPNRDELFAIGEMEPEALIARFNEEYEDFKNVKSDLPEEPDSDKINELLLKIRRLNYS